jgi:hypothetical protein
MATEYRNKHFYAAPATKWRDGEKKARYFSATLASQMPTISSRNAQYPPNPGLGINESCG